jgi:hypothetical protein
VTELQLPVQTEAELRKVNERQAIRIRQLDASVKNLLGCVCLWRWQDERRRERALRRREREQACWDAERFRAAWESPVETRR